MGEAERAQNIAYRLLLFTLSIMAVMTLSVRSYASDMRFTGSAEQPFTTGWEITGDGTITADTGQRLKEFLEANHVPWIGSTLYLESPGGDLMGGLELGRVIRSLGLITAIGHNGCYSACTLAFLGGIWRFNYYHAPFGVHRFRFVEPLPGEGSDSAQIVSGLIVHYLQQMDINPEVFALMTTAPSEGIRLVSYAEQERLGLINNGEGPTIWKIVTRFVEDNVVYLRGARDTMYGINKFIITCTRGYNPSLLGIFSAPHRKEVIMTKLTSHFVFVGENKVPLSDDRISINDDGVVTIQAPLSQRLLTEIAQAKAVGVGVDAGQRSLLFLGFQDMPFSAEASRDLNAVLQMCR